MVSPNAAAASYSRRGRGGGSRSGRGGHAGAHAGAIGTTNSVGVRHSPRLHHNSTVHFSGSSTEFVGSLRPSGYSPPPAHSLNFGETPASLGNSVSSLSQSQSTKSKKRCATTKHAKKPGARRKSDAQDAEQEDAEEDDNEMDMLPVTDGAHSLRTLTEEERRAAEQREAAVVEAHRQELMRTAFPPREIPIGMQSRLHCQCHQVLGTRIEDQRDGTWVSVE
jgi:hypothetical protein